VEGTTSSCEIVGTWLLVIAGSYPKFFRVEDELLMTGDLRGKGPGTHTSCVEISLVKWLFLQLDLIVLLPIC
jgi:hypothetical protein